MVAQVLIVSYTYKLAVAGARARARARTLTGRRMPTVCTLLIAICSAK